jgi:hypothetical protein
MSAPGATAEELEVALRRAEEIAREQGHRLLRPTHLVLDVMSDRHGPWSLVILERGGLSYDSALRRLGWRPPTEPRASAPEEPRFRSSMRLMLLVAVLVAVTLTIGVVRKMLAVRPPPRSRHRLDLNGEAEDVVRLAETLAGGRGAEAKPAAGHLLLALASRPGEHLKVLPNATVLACEVRARLRLATRRHRLILACDRPKRTARRIHMRIDRELAVHGRRSRWGAAWLLYGAAGLLGALAVFFLRILTTALLYLFLWPAALLMAGVRALCGAIVGCEARSYHWLEVPGGDVALTSRSRPASPRAVAAALLAPRFLAAMLSIIVMTAVLWRSSHLGVAVAPIAFRRPDLLTGAAPEALWLGPLSILQGTLEQNGAAAGIGLLAGLGAGVMSIPTFREVELIRLHAGHDTGGGSRFTRAVTAPASVFTGAVACVEAVLPFTGAPLYATAYLVPLFFSALAAIAILQFAPY